MQREDLGTALLLRTVHRSWPVVPLLPEVPSPQEIPSLRGVLGQQRCFLRTPMLPGPPVLRPAPSRTRRLTLWPPCVVI